MAGQWSDDARAGVPDDPNMFGGDPPTTEFRPIITTDAQAMTNPAEVLAHTSVRVKLFGSKAYFRLWLAQLASSMGDWLGFFAITAIAADIGGGAAGASVGLVMIARIAPGFFFSQLAGVIVDRLDRKKVMVVCDLVRAAALVFLPFLTHVWQLVVLSLVLEVATLLWGPAKDASVPNLVPPEHLTTVNSLSLAAAYGTFPIAAVLFAGLAKLADWLAGFDTFDFLELRQASIAVYIDVLTFLLSAFVVSTLPLVHRRRAKAPENATASFHLTAVFHELREGWEFIFVSPVVRAVMLGLATGLFGGGMIVPLGVQFADEVLGGGKSAFGLLLTALGFGVAFGVLAISAVQRRLHKARAFTYAVFGAGYALLLAASMSKLGPAMVWVFVIGVCAGVVYVIGFTILQESVEDELRGRIFSSLNTLVRFCLLMAFALAPFLSQLLGDLSDKLVDGKIHVGIDIALPGPRLTLYFAGLVILGAGLIAVSSFRKGSPTGRVRDLR
ncbi:MAG: MFS transporter [Acidimicrobiia bacterium]